MVPRARDFMAVTPASNTVFVVMPDAQDNQGFRMHRIADNIITENHIAHDIRLWRLRNAVPQKRKETQILDAGYEFLRDTRCGGRIFLRDECPKADQISDGVLGIDQPHCPALGGGNSSGPPQLRSQV